jgi:CheY-like chemotaxis protein
MNRRILVVEDNPANRELLCDWLESQGFEVQAAENLKQAIASYDDQKPDVVLLDIQLGKDDGLCFASYVRQHSQSSQIPVIAVTAHAMVADQERVIQAGCNTCISKPIDFKLLSEHLERWLQHAGPTVTT